MRPREAIAAFMAGVVIAGASSLAAEEPSLDALKWTARPVIVFADSPQDPRFIEQIEDLTRGAADLEERDVVLLTDTEPEAAGPLRRKLRPRGFQIILIGKDGQIRLRRPHPITAEDLNRQIDRTPLRRREMVGGQD